MNDTGEMKKPPKSDSGKLAMALIGLFAILTLGLVGYYVLLPRFALYAYERKLEGTGFATSQPDVEYVVWDDATDCTSIFNDVELLDIGGINVPLPKKAEVEKDGDWTKLRVGSAVFTMSAFSKPQASQEFYELYDRVLAKAEGPSKYLLSNEEISQRMADDFDEIFMFTGRDGLLRFENERIKGFIYLPDSESNHFMIDLMTLDYQNSATIGVDIGGTEDSIEFPCIIKFLGGIEPL